MDDLRQVCHQVAGSPDRVHALALRQILDGLIRLHVRKCQHRNDVRVVGRLRQLLNVVVQVQHCQPGFIQWRDIDGLDAVPGLQAPLAVDEQV